MPVQPALLQACYYPKPLQETVELANRLGAYVASKPGATPTLPATLMQQ